MEQLSKQEISMNKQSVNAKDTDLKFKKKKIFLSVEFRSQCLDWRIIDKYG